MRAKIKLFLIFAFVLLPLNFLLAVPEGAVDEGGQVPSQVITPPAGETSPVLVDLDVKDVDIRDVARIFSRVSGLNVIVGEGVAAKVTFKGTDVPWETALNMILKTYNLTYVREGTFIRVLTYEKLKSEEDGVPLVTKVINLDFSKAADMLANLTTMKSGRGTLVADAKTNSLIITDSPDKIASMMLIVNEIDRRTPQVMIEGMMVDIVLTDQDKLGIDWTVAQKDKYVRNSAGALVPATILQQNLDVATTAGLIQYGKTLLPHWSLLANLQFMVENKKAEILANPKLTTLDGLPAKIELVQQVPYTSSRLDSSTGSITETVTFVDAGIKMNVTPHISSGGYISLDIKTEQSYVASYVGTVNPQPQLNKRTAETNLLIKDGETIVIGGLKEKEKHITVDKLPILGNLPIVGKLFQSKTSEIDNTELLVFITGTIQKEATMSEEEKEYYKQLGQETPGQEKRMGYNKTKPFPMRAPGDK